MKRPMAILRTLAIGATVVALGSAALGADSVPNFANASAVRDGASGTAAAEHATLSIDLPAVASSVMDALVGGTNPSTTLSKGGSAKEHANANANSAKDNHNDE